MATSARCRFAPQGLRLLSGQFAGDQIIVLGVMVRGWRQTGFRQAPQSLPRYSDGREHRFQSLSLHFIRKSVMSVAKVD